jgi:NAD(P)-dependent dehydrogenase (short-subunit alcohol dehydrogenase family)
VSARADVSGMVVLVTGASSGIGRATALQLARPGARLVLASRSAQALAEVERDCAAQGATVLVVPTDVSDPAAVEALFATAVDRFGRVDAVVNSAAVVAYGRLEDVPDEVYDHALEVNLLGTVRVARTALRLFRTQGGGRLVVVGSLLGKIATPYMSSYVAGKWGVHGLVRTLRIEARRTPGVHVSLVSPGSVNTPVYAQAGSFTGRVGRPPPPVDAPEKVARAVVRAIERPRRETSVGLANSLTVFGFRFLSGVFDMLVTLLMDWGGQSLTRVEPNAGNVLEPRPAGEAVHGQWGRRWLRLVPATLAAGSGAAVVAVRRARR